MRQRRLLRVAHVLQQGAGGTDRERQFIDAEAAKIQRAQLIGQHPRGARQVEMPGRTRTNHWLLATARQDVLRLILGQQQFRGTQALQFSLHGSGLVRLKHREAAR